MINRGTRTLRHLIHQFNNLNMARLSKYSRTRNYGDHDADNLTIGDQHHTQPKDRLWAAWREMRARNEAWLKGVEGQWGKLPVRAIEAHAELELLKAAE